MDKTSKNVKLLRFIKLYRSHESLWNLNCKAYRRNDLKKRAYEAISADMKMSVEDVKKKIKSLRTAYSAEKSKVEKSQKSGCSRDSLYTPTLFWYNDMSFVNGCLTRRATIDNSNQVGINFGRRKKLKAESPFEPEKDVDSTQYKGDCFGTGISLKNIKNMSSFGDKEVEEMILNDSIHVPKRSITPEVDSFSDPLHTPQSHRTAENAEIFNLKVCMEDRFLSVLERQTAALERQAIATEAILELLKQQRNIF